MKTHNLPALLITWKRPEHLKKSYEAILKSGIKEIFIYNDGFTESKEINKKVLKTRSLIRKLINENKLISHEIFFSDENSSGCKNGVCNAINWFFIHNKKGLIIEDDVVISEKFPIFCSYYFSKSNKIKFISASTFGIQPSNNKNYRLSRHAYIWGWATTSSLWSKYNKFIEEYRINNFLKKSKNDKHYAKYIKFICDKCKLTNQGLIDTWDYQLSFLLLEEDILNIVPNKSLSENIGFGNDATHTKEKRPSYAKTIHNEIEFDKVKDIDINLIDFKADKAVERLIYIPGIRQKIIRKIYKWLKINQ